MYSIPTAIVCVLSNIIINVSKLQNMFYRHAFKKGLCLNFAKNYLKRGSSVLNSVKTY